MADTTAKYEKGKLYDLPISDLNSDPESAAEINGSPSAGGAEKTTFHQTLLNLQETIQALLNPPAPSNLA